MERNHLIRLGFVLVVAVAVLFSYTQAPDLDGKILDIQFQLLRQLAPKEDSGEVMVVGIDEETTKRFREPVALWHPHWGKFFQAMALSRPQVVGLDIALPDRPYDFLISGYDRPMLAGMMRLRKVAPLVLAQSIEDSGKVRPLFAPILALLGKDRTGLPFLPLDADGIARRFQPEWDTGQGTLPILGAQIASQIGLPLQAGYIDYALGQPFSYIPLQQVIDWFDAGDKAALEQRFGGKIVFLGTMLSNDRHFASIPLAAWEPDNPWVPGVLIHAQVVRTLLDSALIQPIATPLLMLLILAACMMWWLGRRPVIGLLVLLLSMGLLAIYSTYLLRGGVLLLLSSIAFAAGFSLFLRVGLESLFAFKEKRRLRSSFGRYVSPQVMKEIVQGHLHPGADGVSLQVCVLFSDIRSFTTRCEGQTPQDIIALLNRYFDEMTQAVHSHGGTVDKFIGDGLMAFFGAPVVAENPAQDALSAAKEMLRRLDDLNEQLHAEGVEPIRIGVGLHLGDAVVGHMGARDRHEYTAIGDAVNVASRLEGVTKGVGYSIVCSQAVRDVVDEKGFQDLGEQPIKGHTEIKVYGLEKINPGSTRM